MQFSITRWFPEEVADHGMSEPEAPYRRDRIFED